MAEKDRSSSSGVKVLRAMFENGKNGSDIDVRGRLSPVVHSQESQEPQSQSRPLSKVRTSFIPVDDVRRTTSRDKSAADVEITISKNGKSNDQVPDKPVETQQNSTQEQMHPSEATPVKIHTIAAAASEAKENAVNGQRSSQRQSIAKDAIPATRQAAATPTAKSTQPINVAKTRSTSLRETPKPAFIEKIMAKENDGKDKIVKQAEQSSLASPRPKHTQASVASSRLPSFARSTTSNASKAKDTSSSTTNPTKQRKERQPVQGARSATGFIKPRPRSPTRPVALPSHLTAATASSAAKHSEGLTFDALPTGVRSRRPSTYSMASERPSLSNFGTTSATASIARKASATFGPPPRKRAEPTSPQSNTRPSDSFLSRMMRPTTSSASKVQASSDEARNPQRPRVASRLAGPKAPSSKQPAKSRTAQTTRESKAGGKTPKENDKAHPPSNLEPAEQKQAHEPSDNHHKSLPNGDQHSTRLEQDSANNDRQSTEVEEVVVAAVTKVAAGEETSTVTPLTPVDNTVD